MNSSESKVLGFGFWGTVYKPPPLSGNKLLDRFATPQYVLKITNTKAALHALKVANHLRNRCSVPNDYFLIPLPQVRDLVKYPTPDINPQKDSGDKLRKVMNCVGLGNTDDLIGLYMLDGGKTWNSFSLTDENRDKIFKKLLKAVLTLHQCQCTHGDIHGNNIMIDLEGNPKLIDWESCILHRSSSEPLSNHITSNFTWLHCWWKGTLSFNQEKQIESDWKQVALLSETWKETILEKPTDAFIQEILKKE
jgi:serine/threonine protein kinase